MNHVPEIFAESLSSLVRDCQTFEYQKWDEFSQSWNEPRISWHNSSFGLWMDSGTSSDRPSYTFSVSVIWKTVNIGIPNIWNLNLHIFRCFLWAALCLEYAVFFSTGRRNRFGLGQARFSGKMLFQKKYQAFCVFKRNFCYRWPGGGETRWGGGQGGGGVFFRSVRLVFSLLQ